MTSRSEVVCNVCWGEVRDWTRTSENENGAIYEGQCRDCDYYVRIHENDDGYVTILMGGEIA